MSTTVITALIWRAESSFATYQASFRSGLRIVGNVRLLISIITPKQAERNARVVNGTLGLHISPEFLDFKTKDIYHTLSVKMKHNIIGDLVNTIMGLNTYIEVTVGCTSDT